MMAAGNLTATNIAKKDVKLCISFRIITSLFKVIFIDSRCACLSVDMEDKHFQ